MKDDASSDKLKEKYKVIDHYLNGDFIMAHVNTNKEGLSLPSNLLNSGSATLQFSRFFRGKMTLTEQHIEAELLFNGTYFTCTVPISAIWGVTSATNENVIWPEDAPSEVLKSLTTQPKTNHASPDIIKSDKKPFLKRVK